MQFAELRGPQPPASGGPQLVLHSFAFSAGRGPQSSAVGEQQVFARRIVYIQNLCYICDHIRNDRSPCALQCR